MDKGTKSVVWTNRAVRDLERIAKFYIDLYGNVKARQIVTELRQTTELLEQENADLTKIGAIDETFAHLEYQYRKLIHHHCKITYRVGRTKIYVVRVFDTRQNPKKNR